MIKQDIITSLLLKEEDTLGNKENLNYDEFCELMSEKKYKVVYSQFIGELFNNELMDYHVFAKNIFSRYFRVTYIYRRVYRISKRQK